MVNIPFLKKRRKTCIDVDTVELNVSLDNIRSVCEYTEKRAEIALAFSCIHANNRGEYDICDEVTPTYWLLLADEYLDKQGVHSAVFVNIPETADDVFHKAKVVGLDAALEGVSWETEDTVFERMAAAISSMIYEDEIREELCQNSRRRNQYRRWGIKGGYL